MKIHVWGTDFRRSSPEFRSRLFIPNEEREERIKELLRVGFTDLIYLSTCNRVEFYTTALDPFSDTRRFWTRLLSEFGLCEDDFYQGYHLEGKSAMRHLMRVASSLESLVIGEPQILGQLKDALAWSKTYRVPVQRSLERSFQHAFEIAKKVRTVTKLGEKPVSIASLGLRELELSEGKVPLQTAVVIGRSPMSVSVIQWLLENRPKNRVIWVNRSVDALKAFPESQRVEVLSLDQFLANPISFSHLLTATSSTEPLFSQTFFEKLDREPKVIFDFAQPPDVDRESVPTCHVKLIHLEELNERAIENRDARASSVLEAEKLIDEALREFFMEQKEAPILKDFCSVEPVFEKELQDVIDLIEQEFPVELQSKMISLAEKLVKRNLHHSREHLRIILRKISIPEEEVRVV